MLQLSDQVPFAQGNNRACFRHPQNQGRCIKIPLQDRSPEDIHREAPWWKRLRSPSAFDENLRDFNYLTQIYQRLGSLAAQHLPRTFGFVETDLGRGLEIELISDANGQASPPGNKLADFSITWDEAFSALKSLEIFCLQHRILIRDPGPQNLVFQRLEDKRVTAKMIDGYGSSSLIPLEARIAYFARSYIKKKHAKLQKRARFRYQSVVEKSADTLQANPKTLSH